MRRATALLAALAFACAVPAAAQAPAKQAPSYAKHPQVRAFIRDMVDRHGFVEQELVFLFSRARRIDPILEAIAAPAEKAKSWQEYRALFLTERRVSGGLEFWRKHRAALERAHAQFGVPPEYVVAIIGVETLYGRNTGRWRVIDALATLAFDYPPRAQFFRGELESYLLLARDEGINVFSTRGSYAGAYGIPQFMPGSARRYAVDFDGNGAIDLARSPTDAIGSVANFLREHGWRPGGEVLLEARVSEEARSLSSPAPDPQHRIADLVRAGVDPGPLREGLGEERAALIELAGTPSEYRLGLQNFYALTRYNRSALYAAAVHELARTLRAGYDPGK